MNRYRYALEFRLYIDESARIGHNDKSAAAPDDVKIEP